MAKTYSEQMIVVIFRGNVFQSEQRVWVFPDALIKSTGLW